MKQVFSVVGAALALAVLAPPAAAQDLTVQRIAALPSLIGTAPTKPVWSPDSSRLAFLWNDEAMPFRNIWVVAGEGGEPQRITDMAETSHAPGDRVRNRAPSRRYNKSSQSDRAGVSRKSFGRRMARRSSSPMTGICSVWAPMGVRSSGSPAKPADVTGSPSHRMEVSCRFCKVVTSICGIKRRESW